MAGRAIAVPLCEGAASFLLCVVLACCCRRSSLGLAMLLDNYNYVRVHLFFRVYSVGVLLEAGALHPSDIWRDFACECLLSEMFVVGVPVQAEEVLMVCSL